VNERPILFSAPMVRALLDGSKTQTRRVVKMPPSWDCFVCADCGDGWWPHPSDDGESPNYDNNEIPMNCPYGRAGDRLWVRETFSDIYGAGGDEVRRKEEAMYRADGETDPYVIGGRWTPSIHMPRWASRILLEIVSMRVERLQAIGDRDALAEGVERVEDNFGNGPAFCDYGMANPDDTAEWFKSPVDSYKSLWESINSAGSWDANPWVWVVEFKRVEGAKAGAERGGA